MPNGPIKFWNILFPNKLCVTVLLRNWNSLSLNGFAVSFPFKKLPWFIFEETVDYIRIELFAIVFGSLTKFLSLIFIMLQWNGSLYITLIVQMLTSAGFDYGLGTIHILRQHICGLFLTHPLCHHKYSTQRQQNWPFLRPTQSFCWIN